MLLGDGTEVAHSPTEPVPVWVNRDQRHAYYAAMSYVDEHIGALLQALRDESVESSTIVAAHSDHGDPIPDADRSLWAPVRRRRRLLHRLLLIPAAFSQAITWVSTGSGTRRPTLRTPSAYLSSSRRRASPQPPAAAR